MKAFEALTNLFRNYATAANEAKSGAVSRDRSLKGTTIQYFAPSSSASEHKDVPIYMSHVCARPTLLGLWNVYKVEAWPQRSGPELLKALPLPGVLEKFISRRGPFVRTMALNLTYSEASRMVKDHAREPVPYFLNKPSAGEPVRAIAKHIS